jgi:hypothetical protein
MQPARSAEAGFVVSERQAGIGEPARRLRDVDIRHPEAIHRMPVRSRLQRDRDRL